MRGFDALTIIIATVAHLFQCIRFTLLLLHILGSPLVGVPVCASRGDTHPLCQPSCRCNKIFILFMCLPSERSTLLFCLLLHHCLLHCVLWTHQWKGCTHSFFASSVVDVPSEQKVPSCALCCSWWYFSSPMPFPWVLLLWYTFLSWLLHLGVTVIGHDANFCKFTDGILVDVSICEKSGCTLCHRQRMCRCH